MSIEIKKLTPTKKELKQYVKFGIDLYRGNDCFIPPLIFDEINTLLPEKNPAFEVCEAQSFMAFREGKPVGRITAIINRLVNQRTDSRDLRFGFVDFIDDNEVVDALFNAATEWGKERGMTSMVGPMGFSDMDHEGMLTFGFDELGTQATIYNYDYYPKQMERMGFAKDVDWVEYRMTVPDKVPDKYVRIAEIVKQKYNLRVLKYTSAKKIKAEYGQALFQLINEAYDELYGYSPLTPKQIDYYIDMYLPIIPLEYISVIVDSEDRLIGVGISIPSLSKALQSAKGRLFPFGWWKLLRAMKGQNDIVDLMLVAVKPEYQSKGVNALLFTDLLPMFIRNKHKWAESNLELEGNVSVQQQWQYFERRLHRRRSAFRKQI